MDRGRSSQGLKEECVLASRRLRETDSLEAGLPLVPRFRCGKLPTALLITAIALSARTRKQSAECACNKWMEDWSVAKSSQHRGHMKLSSLRYGHGRQEKSCHGFSHFRSHGLALRTVVGLASNAPLE